MLHKDTKDFIVGTATELELAAQKKDTGEIIKILHELTGQQTMASASLKWANGKTACD